MQARFCSYIRCAVLYATERVALKKKTLFGPGVAKLFSMMSQKTTFITA